VLVGGSNNAIALPSRRAGQSASHAAGLESLELVER
jgi:hypothetical protein